MLPVHTRGVQVRSVSPPPRRSANQDLRDTGGSSSSETTHNARDSHQNRNGECVDGGVSTGRRENGVGDPSTRDDDTSSDAVLDDQRDIMSVRAAVKEYESVHDDIRSSNTRTRKLRERAECLRKSLQDFMRSRNLEKLGTRDGRLTVRLAQETLRVRPSKRDTMRCVVDTLGEDNATLAEELIRKLYEEKKETRTVTRLLKNDAVVRRA